MRTALALAVTLVAFIAGVTPTLAAACSGSFALSLEWYSEEQLNAYNLQLLRSVGVNATRAEIWGGCIRVWVQLEDGREEMQFYEPLTLRRVE
jgi:hypothetical protein